MVNTLRALLLTVVVFLIASSASGQTPGSPEDKPNASGLIKLTGDNEKRAKELDKQINKALKDDRWDEAIARTEDLLALRVKAQGPKHFETVTAEWKLEDIAPGGRVAEGGSSRVSIGQRYERARGNSTRSG